MIIEYLNRDELLCIITVDRVFERSRPDRYLILDELGLEHFEPLLIAKKTHGTLWDDYNWLRFDGEELTFKDVQLRR